VTIFRHELRCRWREHGFSVGTQPTRSPNLLDWARGAGFPHDVGSTATKRLPDGHAGGTVGARGRISGVFIEMVPGFGCVRSRFEDCPRNVG